jgi:hypothetical protein
MKKLDVPMRNGSAVLLLIVCAAGFSGCALVDFGAYDSFDAWFVCRKDTFDVEDLGMDLEKYGHPDYVVNDLVVRTPVLVVYDTARIPLILVAAPYYMVKSLVPGDSGPKKVEKRTEG